jgi:hypothetical protein
MDWLQFTASVVGSLAWPIAVVIVGVMFREQFESLLRKVKHAKGAGIELDFSEDVRKLAVEAVEVKADLPKFSEEDLTKPGFRRVDQFDRPNALILTAWAQVESTLLDFIAARGVYIPPNDTDNVNTWISAIDTERVLPAGIVVMVRELLDLRNRVAHTPDYEPTRLDALRYLEAAQAVLTSVRHFHAEAVKGKKIVFGHDFNKGATGS